MGKAIIDKYYHRYLEELSKTNNVTKISRTDFQNYYRQFCGLWTADMGNSNGMQFLAPLIRVGDAYPTHTLTKITGDSNLPAGKLFIVTEGLPILAQSTVKNARQQNLRDEENSSFVWNKVEIMSPNVNTMNSNFLEYFSFDSA